MKLTPYVRVDDTPFSMRREDLERLHGAPVRVQRNGVGLTELDYGEVVFRFQDSTGRLEEVTRRAPQLYLLGAGGVADVPFAGLQAFVRAHDPAAFARAGFLVSPRFGLALVPDQSDWVTALAAHCIGAWRALGE